MSWARVDDGLWEHPKFEALREANAYPAIALWVLAISHAGRKHNERITVLEAMMLLACGREDAERACEALLEVGLFDEAESKHPPSRGSGCLPFASQQSRSYSIHDWQQYRSKNEAKVSAGRKGGKKSAESRRARVEANPKQPDIMFQANAKQTPSPEPEPEPDTRDPNPKRSPKQPAATALTSKGLRNWKRGQPVEVAGDLAVLCDQAGGPPGRGITEKARGIAEALLEHGPIEPREYEAAIDEIGRQEKRPNAGLLASVIKRRRGEYGAGKGDGAPPPLPEPPPSAPFWANKFEPED